MAEVPLSPGGGSPFSEGDLSPRSSNDKEQDKSLPIGSHESEGDLSPRSSYCREQDRLLPFANLIRIMKKGLPPNAKISKDAKATIQECVSEFIRFITSEASDKCIKEKRKTLNGDDLIWALATLGFDEYVEPLWSYLLKYRADTGEPKGVAGSIKDVKPDHSAQLASQGYYHGPRYVSYQGITGVGYFHEQRKHDGAHNPLNSTVVGTGTTMGTLGEQGKHDGPHNPLNSTVGTGTTMGTLGEQGKYDGAHNPLNSTAVGTGTTTGTSGEQHDGAHNPLNSTVVGTGTTMGTSGEQGKHDGAHNPLNSTDIGTGTTMGTFGEQGKHDGVGGDGSGIWSSVSEICRLIVHSEDDDMEGNEKKGLVDSSLPCSDIIIN